jgi:hypothetical protein
MNTKVVAAKYCGLFEKQPLLSNGCVTCNNGETVGSGVFCTVRVEAL